MHALIEILFGHPARFRSVPLISSAEPDRTGITGFVPG
jgi:hypothetical protein